MKNIIYYKEKRSGAQKLTPKSWDLLSEKCCTSAHKRFFRLPLSKKLFPVDRLSELKSAD